MEWLYAIDFLIAIGIKVENYPPSRLGIIRRNISIILQKKRHNVQSRIKKRTNGRKKYSFLFSKTETLFYAPVFQVRAKNYISYKYLSDFDIENDIPICKWKIKEPKMISSFIFKRQKKDRF